MSNMQTQQWAERLTTSAPLEQLGAEPSTLVGHMTHWQLCSDQSSLRGTVRARVALIHVRMPCFGRCFADDTWFDLQYPAKLQAQACTHLALGATPMPLTPAERPVTCVPCPSSSLSYGCTIVRSEH